jgi:hypothetical protein
MVFLIYIPILILTLFVSYVILEYFEIENVFLNCIVYFLMFALTAFLTVNICLFFGLDCSGPGTPDDDWYERGAGPFRW